MPSNGLLSWLQGSDSDEYNGNPIADALKGGRQAEYRKGEISEYNDHPVIVEKFYKKNGDDSSWVVRVKVPNGPKERHVTRYYDTQFEADAVFEKVDRMYDLEEWEPEFEEGE